MVTYYLFPLGPYFTQRIVLHRMDDAQLLNYAIFYFFLDSMH